MIKEKITKELAITEFKKLCTDSFSSLQYQRYENVATQKDRDCWSLDLEQFVFVIYSNKGICELLVYNAFGSTFGNNRTQILREKFTISNEEYIDLKKHYFGEFTVDSYYMKEISDLTSKWKNIKDLDAKKSKVIKNK